VTGILFANARIFDGNGPGTFPGSVLVDGDRIVQVARAEEPSASQPPICRVIDCGGRTLMPGMVEAHAHLTWPSSTERIVRRFKQPIEEMTLHATRNARVLLDHGFTAAYSAGALADRLEAVLRDEIDGGWLPGPRRKASTIERSPVGGAGSAHHGRGPDAMRTFIDNCAANRIDSVKLLLSGENALKPGGSQDILYTEEEVAAASTAAKRHGLWLAAHTQAAESIKMALRNDVRILYHCTYADEEALDMLEAARDNIFVAPAIGVIVATIEAMPSPSFDMTALKEAAKPVIERACVLMPELKRRGVRVLPGGDYGFPFNPNGRNARDLKHFVDLFGYSAAQALQAATRFGGELFGQGHELGRIAEGYLADLLVVDGDPLANVALLEDASSLAVIMKAGVIHKMAPGLMMAT
jgi:imidazolonepropionase-like amidohydrolase